MRLLRDLDIDMLQFSDSEDVDSPLKELILLNYNGWLQAEQSSQFEMTSYLKARYITDQIFTNTTIYSNSAVYYGKDLVQLTAPSWDENTSYTSIAGEVISYEGKIYQCINNSQGYLPTNTTYWIFLCDSFSLFYLTLNQPEWNPVTKYAAGDQIWYNKRNYTAVVANNNILPDSSTSIWQDDGLYSVTATSPLDVTKWTPGDNRNQQIISYLLDISLYHFLKASPRNLADLRKERYDGNSPEQRGGAIAWLKRVSKGEVFAELPVIIPRTGEAIQYGNSNSLQGIKQDNQLW